MSVFDARCEITSLRTLPPITIELSEGASCLALIGLDPSDKSPGLACFFPDKPDYDVTEFWQNRFVNPGLANVAHHIAMDESRGLVFVGDNDRVKSYAWETPDPISDDEPFPVHTLNSNQFSGPLAVLSNETVVRAGKGGASLWNVSKLETHGKKGDKIIGEEKDLDYIDSRRSDSEFVELSSGSPPTSHIKFVDQPSLRPAVWHSLRSHSSTVLCVEDATESGNGVCSAIDLEGGGKTTARYLGHGGAVSNFSQSAQDPQVFLTACGDGFARLFDVRQSLPVLTFDACGQDEFCRSAVLTHPDGIPSTSDYRLFHTLATDRLGWH